MKSWYQSRTIWFNVVGPIVEIAAYVVNNWMSLGIQDDTILQAAIAIQAIGNILLRFQTSQPIGTEPPPGPPPMFRG